MRKIIDVTGTSNVFGGWHPRTGTGAAVPMLLPIGFGNGQVVDAGSAVIDQPGPALTFGYIISRGSRIERRPAP